MSDADQLRRLALAAVGRAENLQRRFIADPFEAAPEVRRDAAIVVILDHGGELTALDQLSPFTTKLELVARIVDRPRAVGAHEYAMFDPGDHFLERRVTRLDIQVGHAIDRRPVPAVGAGVRHPGDTGTGLRNRTAKGALEDAVADQIRALGAGALIVEGIARKLLRPCRIECHVQEVGPVAVAAEHVERYKARSGEIALVAENAIELERMADRLVDLQHHLVGQQQRVHDTQRAVWRGEKLQRLVGDAGSAADVPETLEHRLAALLRKAAVAVQRAHLRISVSMRGDGQIRHDEAKTLAQLAAFAGEVDVFRGSGLDARFPIDDARIAPRCAGFIREELVPLAARPRLRTRLRRRVSSPQSWSGQGSGIDQRAWRAGPRPRRRAIERGLQAGTRQGRGGSVSVPAAGVDGEHRTAVE